MQSYVKQAKIDFLRGLDPELVSEFERLVVRHGFVNVDMMWEWLSSEIEERGLPDEAKLGRTTVWRFMVNHRAMLRQASEAAEYIRALGDVARDDLAILASAAMQAAILNAMKALSQIEEGDIAKNLKLLSVIAQLANSQARLSEFQAKARKEIELATQEVSDVAKKGGLSEDAIQQIQQIMGLLK